MQVQLFDNRRKKSKQPTFTVDAGPATPTPTQLKKFGRQVANEFPGLKSKADKNTGAVTLEAPKNLDAAVDLGRVEDVVKGVLAKL